MHNAQFCWFPPRGLSRGFCFTKHYFRGVTLTVQARQIHVRRASRNHVAWYSFSKNQNRRIIFRNQNTQH